MCDEHLESWVLLKCSHSTLSSFSMSQYFDHINLHLCGKGLPCTFWSKDWIPSLTHLRRERYLISVVFTLSIETCQQLHTCNRKMDCFTTRGFAKGWWLVSTIMCWFKTLWWTCSIVDRSTEKMRWQLLENGTMCQQFR